MKTNWKLSLSLSAIKFCVDIKTGPHSSYTPHLAPCDFWLFTKLKKYPRGNRFEYTEKMKEVVAMLLNILILDDLHGDLMNWLERYNKGIEVRGAYFEGDKSFVPY